MQNGMKKKDYGTDIIKYLLSAAVACFLLYFTFRGVKWDDFITGIKSCRWGYILVSMAAGIAAFWFRGLRWRGYCQEKGLLRQGAWDSGSGEELGYGDDVAFSDSASRFQVV